MDKTFFSVGFLHFYQFGTILAIGALCGLIISFWEAHLKRQPFYVVGEAFILAIPCAVFCARVFFAMIHSNLFAANPLEILYFWHGGFSAEGAVIGGVGSIYLYMKYTGRDFWKWMDTFTPGLAIGQFIGQIAYVANQVNFGYPVKNGWGIYIDFAFRPEGYKQYDFFEPVCLYQAGWALFLFAASFIFNRFSSKHRWPSGISFLLYVIFYNAANIVTEGMTLTTNVFELEFAQVFIVLLGIAALSLLVRRIYRTSYRYAGTAYKK